jgi:5-hydroxyisourate hydrolase-like protein (transthyretin family)
MAMLRVLCAFLIVVMSAAAAAAAQQPSLSGQVVDATASPLPGVSIQATSVDRKTTQTTVTDRDGRYQFASLAAGQYGLTFSMHNFADVRRRGVTIVTGAPVRLDVTMQLSLSAAVVVTAREIFRNLADLTNPAENLVGVANAASEGAVTARQVEARPIMRAGEVLEAVPGVIISQHSGEGKANQYYLRGFNLDHGTDFATTVAGVPVNLPTHAHGQGYSDVNFLIPELVSGVQFKKGPYSAQEGDFSAAGSANINYANVLAHPVVSASVGQDGWARFFAAASPRVGSGHLLAALELNGNDGPWTLPDDYRRVNGIVRYSRGTTQNAFSVTGLFYDATWNATDQVPDRAVASGLIPRFGHIDSTDGGQTSRHSLVGDFQRASAKSVTRATAYVSRYQLNLFSNFTYALDDPERGDQFEQADRRWVTGARVSQTRRIQWGSRVGEATIGAQVRHDAIPLVGLYHTEARVRLSTTRQDDVAQTSAGGFAEAELRWLPWLRTTGGLRLDAYRFAVTSSHPENSGKADSAIVSPKGGAILGPWRDTEFYVNAGLGYHSNDARGTTMTRDPVSGEPVDPVTPLVRAKGAEVGFRTVAIPRVQTTVTLWRLDLASEQLFVGDAGTTEAGRPSERYGVEWTNYVRLSSNVTIDADVAWSHARFADADPAGNWIPGSPGLVSSAGVTVDRRLGLFGSLRFRYFGSRPLVEDNSVRSKATGILNGQFGYHLTPRLHLVLDAFNLLDAEVSDIDYFYTSRLPGEPAAGIDDIHTHPTLPRSVRLVFRVQF